MAKPQIPLQTSLLQLGAKVNIFHDIYKKKPIFFYLFVGAAGFSLFQFFTFSL